MTFYQKFGGTYQFSGWVYPFLNKREVIELILNEVDVYGCLANNVQAGIPMGIPHPQPTEFVS